MYIVSSAVSLATSKSLLNSERKQEYAQYTDVFLRTCHRNRSLGNLCNFLFTTGIVQLNVAFSCTFQNVLFMCSLVTP